MIRLILELSVAVVVTLLVIERTTRMIMPYRSYEEWRRSSLRYTYHSDYYWFVKPGVYLNHNGEEFTVNELGVRENLPQKRKPRGTLRVVVLG